MVYNTYKHGASLKTNNVQNDERGGSDLELNHLRYFREVAQTENISRAAKALYITQPALSVTIRRLEAELGYDLFVRKGNKIKLTDAGQCFLSYVNSMFSLLDEGIEKSRVLANESVNMLRVSSGFGILRDMTNEYLAENPEAKIGVKCRPTDEIVNKILDDRADVGFILGHLHDSRLEERVVMNGRFYLFVNDEHPFSRCNSICMKDLEGQLLFCSNIAKTHAFASRMLQRAGISCNLLTLDEKDVLFSAAEKGLGAVFCMPMMDVHSKAHDMAKDNCHFIPIRDCPERGPVVMLWRKGEYFTDEQTRYLRYIEQRFARNEEWIEKDWKERGIL